MCLRECGKMEVREGQCCVCVCVYRTVEEIKFHNFYLCEE